MADVTPAEVTHLAAAIGLLWPDSRYNRGVPERVMIEAWLTVLGDIEYEHAQAALIDYARTGAEFPPPPGVIAAGALTLSQRLAGKLAPGIDRALMEVRLAAERGADSKQPEWSHPAIAAAVKAMGWRNICLDTNPGTFRAQFTKLYESARERIEAKRRRTPAMTALIEGRPLHPALAAPKPRNTPGL